MDKELISVIVPIYNVEEYLPTCLNSIAQQTYTNIEVILIDDGSVDRSGQICDEFVQKDHRFKVFHQRNTGIPGARNAGLEHVSGQYVSFIDSDDYFHPRMLEIMHKELVSSDYSCSVCKEKYINDFIQPSEISSYKTFVYSQQDIIKIMFEKGKKCAKWYYIWNKLFKRDVLYGLKFSNVAYEEDLDLILRFYLKINKLIYIDTELYYYLQRSTSITHINNLKNTVVKIPVRVNYLNYFNSVSSKQLKDKYISYFLPSFYRLLIHARYNAYNTDYHEITEKTIKEALDKTYSVFKSNKEIPFLVKINKIYNLSFPTQYRISRNILIAINSFFIYRFRDIKRLLTNNNIIHR